MHINSNNKGYYWFDQLQPYLNTTWTDQGVFKCPDNKLNNAAGGLSDIVNGTLPRGSYGMNTHGAKVTYFGKSMLGLGVSRNAAIEGFERTKFIPRNTDDIQSPWKFISFGDGLLSRSGHRIEGFFNIQAFAHGYVKENPKLSSLEDSIHKGRSNVSFLDLHIQPEDKSALFKNTLENRKRWHFDDKPHLELKIIIR
jgi:prepilin-type processing-associated H-X9-DG protein